MPITRRIRVKKAILCRKSGDLWLMNSKYKKPPRVGPWWFKCFIRTLIKIISVLGVQEAT